MGKYLFVLLLFTTNCSSPGRQEVLERYADGQKKVVGEYQGSGVDEILAVRYTFDVDGLLIQVEDLATGNVQDYFDLNDGKLRTWSDTIGHFDNLVIVEYLGDDNYKRAERQITIDNVGDTLATEYAFGGEDFSFVKSKHDVQHNALAGFLDGTWQNSSNVTYSFSGDIVETNSVMGNDPSIASYGMSAEFKYLLGFGPEIIFLSMKALHYFNDRGGTSSTTDYFQLREIYDPLVDRKALSIFPQSDSTMYIGHPKYGETHFFLKSD